MSIHGVDQTHEAARVKALHQLFAVRVQPLVDLKHTVVVFLASKTRFQRAGRAITQHTHHAREREPLVGATNGNRPTHDRVPRESLRRLRGRRGQHDRLLHAIREARGEFQRDHSTQ